MQGAAKAYSFEEKPRFTKWWDSVLILDEREAFELSCQIEHNTTYAGSGHSSASKIDNKYLKRKTQSLQGMYYHRKNDSIASTGSSSSSSQVIASFF